VRRLRVVHDHPAMFQPSPLVAEAYHPPSSEARRLVRRAPWLTSPERGEATAAARLSLRVLVAPMTQLTFCSFELQAFLFLVFHRTRVAILGHGLFMTTENLFLMAALREVPLAQTPVGVVSGAPVYAVLLLAWYAGVAWRARLPGWFAVTLPVVALLYAASGPLDALCRDRLLLSPAWGVLLSAFLVAFSHAPEPLLPPRTVDRWRWVPLREYMDGRGLGAGRRLARMLHLVIISVLGIPAEAWAALRLMHYNWLILMMRLGYAPERYAELEDWTERAWATGQPALDFVGTGGGTFLASANEGSGE
jgi:hypothetical protein